MTAAPGPSRAPRLARFYDLTYRDAVGSTNDEAKTLAAAGAPEGTLVWAERQTGGRGRRGNRWHSPAGNLYCSLVLRPSCAAATAAQLSFVAALGLGQALAAIAANAATAATAPNANRIRYKWPNDVLWDGRKVAGILLESQPEPDGALEWLVIGVGVNVTSHPPDAMVDWPATSLLAAGLPGVDAATVLAAFAAAFSTWLGRWREHGFAPVREAWLERAGGLGQAIEVRLPDRTLTGTFADLDRDGALVIRDAGGERRTVVAGAVYFGAGLAR